MAEILLSQPTAAEIAAGRQQKAAEAQAMANLNILRVQAAATIMGGLMHGADMSQIVAFDGSVNREQLDRLSYISAVATESLLIAIGVLQVKEAEASAA